ncbi:MAG: 3'-5' exonuclease [Gemmatimonadetes bacterium]|nr:3'-5' exonuclease [Gemmatimonadota bacterium]
MTSPGVRAQRSGTLVDRALELLATGPVESLVLAHQVMGVPAATPPIADRLATALLGADPRVRRRGDARWELVRSAAGSPRLVDCTFAVVDVETTGSSPSRGDRVIEIAVATLSGGRVEMVMDTLVNPGRPIPRAVTGITRITHEDVADRSPFRDLAGEVVAALAGRVFVAHNMRFDWAFVSAEVGRALDVTLDGPRLCTVLLSRRLIAGLKSRGLDSVARYFGIEIEHRHRAGGDAMATAAILNRLIDLAGERGIDTLHELEDLTRRRKKRKQRKRRRALPVSMEEA